jgi:outer membrane receptor protein involved in Fe transport
MRIKKTRVAQAVATLVFASISAQIYAQEVPPVSTLGAIEVKGQALLQSDSSSATQTTFEAEEIRDAAIAQPEQLFSRVPGMRVNNYNLGGVVNVISLRGFGGGAHGGDLGFVLDGITLNEAISHSDGYADLNVVIPLELQRMDVVKGPSSVLVGNYNRAGSVFLQTRKGGEYQLADFSVGSFRTVDAQVAGATSSTQATSILQRKYLVQMVFAPIQTLIAAQCLPVIQSLSTRVTLPFLGVCTEANGIRSVT